MMETTLRKTNARPFIIIALIVIMAITLVSYYMIWQDYSEQQTAQDDLNFQLDMIWPRVQVSVATQPEDQEERLKTAREELEIQQAAFPARITSTEAMESLLQLADEHQISISLKTQMENTESSPAQTLEALRFNMRASGSLSNLIAFISYLEDGPIQTLKIEPMGLDGSGNSWSTSFNMTIYTQTPPPLPENQQPPTEEI